jgi:hypothetical protein
LGEGNLGHTAIGATSSAIPISASPMSPDEFSAVFNHDHADLQYPSQFCNEVVDSVY